MHRGDQPLARKPKSVTQSSTYRQLYDRRLCGTATAVERFQNQDEKVSQYPLRIHHNVSEFALGYIPLWFLRGHLQLQRQQ